MQYKLQKFWQKLPEPKNLLHYKYQKYKYIYYHCAESATKCKTEVFLKYCFGAEELGRGGLGV